jgi:nucleotide-binding universal stress UspA family protein
VKLALRSPTRPEVATETSAGRPVMLVTFDVPFEPDATAFAVDAAVEAGQPLIVVNAAEVPLGPISLSMKYEYVGTQEVEDALQVPTSLALGLGAEVERIRLCSPRPVDALLELVAERAPGLLVVGPDQTRMRKRAYAKVVKKISSRAACLVWLAA